MEPVASRTESGRIVSSHNTDSYNDPFTEPGKNLIEMRGGIGRHNKILRFEFSLRFFQFLLEQDKVKACRLNWATYILVELEQSSITFAFPMFWFKSIRLTAASSAGDSGMHSRVFASLNCFLKSQINESSSVIDSSRLVVLLSTLLCLKETRRGNYKQRVRKHLNKKYNQCFHIEYTNISKIVVVS